MLLLAGDMGGTRSRLRITDLTDDSAQTLFQQVQENRSHPGPAALLQHFLEAFAQQGGQIDAIEQAILGVAGPVFQGHCHMSNLPWHLDSRALAEELGIPRLTLVNDLVLAAHGIETCRARIRTLQPATLELSGPTLVIGVGTGLGQAMYLDREDGREVFPSEAGRMHFAPGNRFDVDLLEQAWDKGLDPCNETFLSAGGLADIYRHLREVRTGAHEDAIPAPGVTRLATDGDHVALDAVQRFASMLGIHAGNAVLQNMTVAGVYLTGGVATALAEEGHLSQGAFLSAFSDQGRLSALLESIPVRAVLDDDIALAGAVQLARFPLNTGADSGLYCLYEKAH